MVAIKGFIASWGEVRLAEELTAKPAELEKPPSEMPARLSGEICDGDEDQKIGYPQHFASPILKIQIISRVDDVADAATSNCPFAEIKQSLIDARID